MLIEFVGIPGSGKSHFADRLRKWLDRAKLSYVDVDEFVRSQAAQREENIPRRGQESRLDLGAKEADVLLKSFRWFMVEEPRYVLEYLGTLFRLETDKHVTEIVASAFCFCCATRGYFLRRSRPGPSDIVIHEEGFTHRLFTLFGYRRGGWLENRQLKTLARLTPKPDALFWTRCSSRTAFQRLENRTRKMPDRLVGIARSEAERILSNADMRLQKALAVLASRSVRIIELRTDGDFDDSSVFRQLFDKGSTIEGN